MLAIKTSLFPSEVICQHKQCSLKSTVHNPSFLSYLTSNQTCLLSCIGSFSLVPWSKVSSLMVPSFFLYILHLLNWFTSISHKFCTRTMWWIFTGIDTNFSSRLTFICSRSYLKYLNAWRLTFPMYWDTVWLSDCLLSTSTLQGHYL